MRLPDFVVIGAQKSGSTYLLNCLRAHPGVFMPREEISFCESEPLTGEALQRFARHFREAAGSQLVGVKRPNLLGTVASPARLAAALPDCKLLTILRNPLERAVSGYFHYMATGLLPVEPLEAGLSRLLDGDTPAGFPRALEVLTFGRYAEHLRRYAEYFPRERIHIEFLDDVRRDPRGVLQRAFQFLGLENHAEIAAIQEKPMQAPYSLTRLRIRRWIYEGSRQRRADSAYYQAKAGWWAMARRGIGRAVDDWVLSKIFSNAPPVMSAALRGRLLDYYRDDVTSLMAWSGRRLDSWLDSQKAIG